MKKIFCYLLSAVGLFSCSDSISPTRTSTATNAVVSYETDLGDPFTDEDEEGEGNARLAATQKGKITFQYLNNETEIFRPSFYSVKLWRFDAEPTSTSRPTIAPKYTIKKTTTRSYTRKTVQVGWYIAEYFNGADGTDERYKFEVGSGSNGLLCHNENSSTSVHFLGYYSAFGKIKCSWKIPPRNDETANLTLTKGGAAQNFWLYAEDGTGKYRGQFWFMPVGTYSFTMPGMTNAGSITIAETGKFPHLKFF